MNTEKNYFNELFGVNVLDKVETKKSGNTTLSYLSWAWAWAEVKKRFPDAQYKIHRYGEDNAPYHFDKALGYMVSTEVTINDITHEMWLPVMNHSNKAMKDHEYTYETKFKKDNKVEQATMFDVNTTIMRCLVKNIGMHGLGLHIYAGEDIPRDLEQELANEQTAKNNASALENINKIMPEIVKKQGDKSKAYEWLGLTEETFLQMYKNNPTELQSLVETKLNEPEVQEDLLEENEPLQEPKATKAQIKELKKFMDEDRLQAMLEHFEVEKLEDMNSVDVANTIKSLKANAKKNEPKKEETKPAKENVSIHDL